MIKNITQIEAVINEKKYILLCEMDAPVVDLIEALDAMRARAVQIIEDAQSPKLEEAECLST